MPFASELLIYYFSVYSHLKQDKVYKHKKTPEEATEIHVTLL